MLSQLGGGVKRKMKTKSTITTITALTLASALIISGFNLPAAEAQTFPSVKKVVVTSVGSQGKIYESQPRTIAYTYVFEACAGKNAIRAPEVVVTSDSEVRSVKLALDLNPEACVVSATKIKAANPDTISAKLFTKETVTNMANNAELRLANVKMMLAEKNAELQKLVKQPSSSANTSKLVQITDEVVELRKQLKDARGEYYRLLFLIHG
ncbi:hypothetical protein [Nitrosopumilus piranensis]|uniref:Uncharacterized protein n=1 Tax=Nitrosopumilus piranensis TaxID=1582439 RepID=A0A0C5CD40_9ARCH|nr:hypothetical protein [Nitrosopumilus piranensis]AJM93117.1 conserved exported protein of unknown function [Nitrosopumilus piranensis]